MLEWGIYIYIHIYIYSYHFFLINSIVWTLVPKALHLINCSTWSTYIDSRHYTRLIESICLITWITWSIKLIIMISFICDCAYTFTNSYLLMNMVSMIGTKTCTFPTSDAIGSLVLARHGYQPTASSRSPLSLLHSRLNRSGWTSKIKNHVSRI